MVAKAGFFRVDLSVILSALGVGLTIGLFIGNASGAGGDRTPSPDSGSTNPSSASPLEDENENNEPDDPEVSDSPTASPDPPAEDTWLYQNRDLELAATRFDTYIDLREVTVVFDTSDVQVHDGSNHPTCRVTCFEVRGAFAFVEENHNVTPEYCAERLQAAKRPPGSSEPAVAGDVICIQTDQEADEHQGNDPLMAFLEFVDVDGREVNVRVSAWEVAE